MSNTRYAERDRGVTLTVLDLDPLLSKLAEEVQDRMPDSRLEFRMTYAVAEKDGKTFVVCNEGVGWKVTEEDPLEVAVFSSSPEGFSMFPQYRIVLSPDEVRKYATGEKIDLADLVRTFGGRLEDNFWIWHHTLTTGEE